MVEFQIRAGQQMPTSSAELPAKRTAASRFWLEPRGWVHLEGSHNHRFPGMVAPGLRHRHRSPCGIRNASNGWEA